MNAHDPYNPGRPPLVAVAFWFLPLVAILWAIAEIFRSRILDEHWNSLLRRDRLRPCGMVELPQLARPQRTTSTAPERTSLQSFASS